MYYSYLPASQLKRLFSPFMPSEHYSLGLFSLQKSSADELELVGWAWVRNGQKESGHDGLADARSSGVLRQLDEATRRYHS